ncbi:MAG TPA: ABC transporter permease [Azospirillaceae bacterium]|nr:ABC transporter permease [Azospirillaceae bacterium]
MLGNYLTVAFRNLVKHRLYSAINIFGLAIGLAAAILILLFVRNELSYDGFHPNADRVYQATAEATIPGRPTTSLSRVMPPLAGAIKDYFPEEIEDVLLMINQGSVVKHGEALFSEQLVTTTPNFFQFFEYRFLRGDAASALNEPDSVVLTESAARKYFGDKDPLNQILTFDNKEPVRVTGVIEDLPANTQLQFDILLNNKSKATRARPEFFEQWGALCCFTYVKLKEGVDIAQVRGKLQAFMKAKAPDQNGPTGSFSPSEAFKIGLRNVKDVHTEPMLGDMRPGISMTEIYTFSAVAALVLVVASINFMNLATARATQRAREVSVRKVVGASRSQIVGQFLGESVLLTVIGLLLAIAVVELALPAYSDFLGKDLVFNYLSEPSLLAMLLALTLVVGVAGGAYPAFFLSSFKPAAVLKGSASGVGGGSGRLRTALVVVQFSISIMLMAATAVVYGQRGYAMNKDLGFDRENVVAVEGVGRRDARDRREAFIEQLRKEPLVAAVASTSVMPGDGDENNVGVRVPGGDPNANLTLRNDSVGFGYFQTMGMRIIAGRDFDRDRVGDAIPRDPPGAQPAAPDAAPTTRKASVVLNQGAVRRLGYASPEAAIGQTFTSGDPSANSGSNATLELTVIGVVEDFHYRSVTDPISAGMFLVDPNDQTTVAVRLKAGDVQAALTAIDRVWRQVYPDLPVRRQFLDERLQELYLREATTSQLFAAFSGLAIVIACLGLFGLASFTAERRTKEIGLRKVLGARVPDIVRLLVWQFSKPVLLANIIAWPIAWYGASRWLEGFTYRIDLNPLPFVGAGLAALLIAWLTVGMHATRVASAKPVAALRYE